MARVAVPYRFEEKVQPYLIALRSVGVESVPMYCSGRAILPEADGLLLMGGTDVNPALYGVTPAPETDQPDTERDEFEFAILRQALDADIPVFAICRGVQLLNVFLGGTLSQHVTDHRMLDGGTHPIHVDAGSLLHEIVGSREIVVNSRHHQALDRVADSLVVCGKSADGLIEAVYRPGAPLVLGVQWHPEDRIVQSATDRNLFEAFAAACGVPA